jgi:PKD repeat protein
MLAIFYLMGDRRLVAAVTIVFVIIIATVAAIGFNLVNLSQSENQAPTCSLTPDHDTGDMPLLVIFTLNASDADGSIVSWSIDGDGDNVTDDEGVGVPPINYIHSYSDAGIYNATFFVVDDDGANASSNVTIIVTGANQAPSCHISSDPPEGVAPLTVAFELSATDIDGYITSWSIDINPHEGDDIEYSGSGEPPEMLTHIFLDPGSYQVHLQVVDDDYTFGYGFAWVYVS